MDYSIAKKLKDAGFPHKPFSTCQKYVGEDGKVYPYGTTYEGKVVKLPTLSELIAACPTYLFDQEFNLHATHEEGRVEWCACYISPLNLNGSAKHLSLGETPEEAVANLWLALNEKNP